MQRGGSRRSRKTEKKYTRVKGGAGVNLSLPSRDLKDNSKEGLELPYVKVKRV